jgi:hypothetical protein
MYALLRRSAPRPSSSARPALERLEDRNCPSPVITMRPSYGAGQTVTMTGSVMDRTDPNGPGGLTVNFGGVVSGSTTTDARGFFRLTMTASSLGNVTATVTDDNGDSGAASVALADNLAVNNFVCSCDNGNIWTFSGTVTGSYVQGLVIDFSQSTPSALANESITVQSDGTFSLTIELNNGDCGAVIAQVTDGWGHTAVGLGDVMPT